VSDIGGYTTYFGPIGTQEGDYSILLDYFAGYDDNTNYLNFGALLLMRHPYVTHNTQHTTRNTQHATRNTQHNRLGHHMVKKHENPAEFILEVTGAGIPKTVPTSVDELREQPSIAKALEEKEEESAQDGIPMDNMERGKTAENFYVDAYLRSQPFAAAEEELTAGIFPAVWTPPHISIYIHMYIYRYIHIRIHIHILLTYLDYVAVL
jgi:hypothetical protein